VGIWEHAGDYAVVECASFDFVDDYPWRVQLVLRGLLRMDEVSGGEGKEDKDESKS
jgi:hypothetical protein